MAKNQSGAQHLTSLDLDISGIAKSLEDAKRQIEEFSQEIGVSLKENAGNKFSEAFNLSNLSNSVQSSFSDADKALADALIKFSETSGKGFQRFASENESSLKKALDDSFQVIMEVTEKEKKWLQEYAGESFGSKLKFVITDDEKTAWEQQLSSISTRYKDFYELLKQESENYKNNVMQDETDLFNTKQDFYEALIRVMKKLKEARAGTYDDELFDENATNKLQEALEGLYVKISKIRQIYGDTAVDSFFAKYQPELEGFGKGLEEVTGKTQKFKETISSGTGTGGLLDKFEINLEEKFGFGSIEDKFQEMREQIAGSATELERINAIYDKNQNIIGVSVDYVTQEKDRYHELYEMVNVAAEGEKERYELKLKNTRVIDDEAKKERERIKEQEKAQREQVKINDEIDRTVQKFERMGVTAKNSGYGELAEQANTAALSLRDIKNLVNDGSISFENATQQVKAFNAQYAELSTKILDEKGFQSLLQQTKALESQFIKLSQQSTIKGFDELSNEALQFSNILKELTKYLQENGTATEKDVNTIKSFSDALDKLKKKFGEQNVFARQAKEIESFSKQLNTLSNRFEVLAGKAEKSGNKELSQQAQQASSSIQQLIEKLKNQSVLLDEDKVQLNTYSEQLTKLQREYANTGAAHESFMKAIVDKARWYAAFQIQYQFMDLLKSIPDIIVQTEDAVVELRRVLSQDIGVGVISDELYNIGFEFGRTFEDVSEVATKFAQAGYDWNDVIELTRGTMLALNTAELDVTQSTQGLIAVLQQWGLQAEDYAEVIDKINITGDNFAVTSETIVAALQRASSSAKNANISLEQTIGIITALAEATGRSGENIGTALNSLIVYTTKAQSLDVFAGLSSRMDEVVQKYRSGATSIYDVWLNLSDELQGLNAQQQEALLKMTDYESFADELEREASEYTDKIRSTYETAGSYRQNYFIALLKDMATVEDVMDNMAESQGYSAKENENYMESFSAMANQLKSMLAQLAVQVGEGKGGLLEIMKALVQFGISVTSVTKKVGGLVPVLGALLGVMLQVRAAKISDAFTGLLGLLPKLIKRLSTLVETFNAVRKAQGFLAAMNTVLQTAFGWVGVATVAISGLIGAFNLFKTSAEEAKQAARDNATANMEEAESLEQLKQQYIDILNSKEDEATRNEKLASLKDTLIKGHYSEKEAIDKLNLSTKEGIKLFDELYNAEIRAAYVEIKDQYQEAANVIEHANKSFFIKTDDVEASKNILGDYFKFIEEKSMGNNRYFEFYTENLQEQIDLLNEILTIKDLDEATENALTKLLKEKKQLLEDNNDIYKQYTETVALGALQEEEIQKRIKAINTQDDAEKRLLMFADLVRYIDELNLGYAVTENMLEVLRELFGYATDESGEATDSMDGFTQSIATSAEELEEIRTEIDNLNASVDDFQSGYSTLIDAMNEFNQSGYLSIDTVQKLVSLGSDYIGVLSFTKNGITLNESALRSLLNAQEDNINGILAQSAAESILELANEYLESSTEDVANAEDAATKRSTEFQKAIYDIATAAINGTTSVSAFGDSIKEAFLIAGGDSKDLLDFTNKAVQRLEYYQNLGKSLGNIGANLIRSADSASGSAAKSASDAQKKLLEEQKKAKKEAYDAEKDALDKQKKQYKDLYDEQNKALDAQKESQKEIYDNDKKILEQRKKALKEQYDANKEALEEQKKAAEDYYDTELEKLKEVEDERDREREKEEYYRRRQEILDDIERYSTRSGIDYREQENDARKQLNELDLEWQQKIEDWNAEDQIKEIEKVRDASIAAFEAELDKLQELYDANVNDIEKQLELIKETYDMQTKAIEKQLDALKDSYDAQVDMIEAQLEKIKEIYESEVSAIEKELDVINKAASSASGAAGGAIGSIGNQVSGLFDDIEERSNRFYDSQMYKYSKVPEFVSQQLSKEFDDARKQSKNVFKDFDTYTKESSQNIYHNVKSGILDPLKGGSAAFKRVADSGILDSQNKISETGKIVRNEIESSTKELQDEIKKFYTDLQKQSFPEKLRNSLKIGLIEPLKNDLSGLNQVANNLVNVKVPNATANISRNASQTGVVNNSYTNNNQKNVYANVYGSGRTTTTASPFFSKV